MSLVRTYLELFRRSPALARLLAGEFISGIGDWLYLVAILVEARIPEMGVGVDETMCRHRER